MRFALLQTEAVIPSLNQLKRAFRVLPNLRDLDAQTSFNDAYGIILRGLEYPEAHTLQAALEEEDIPTAVVAEDLLPVVPLGRTLRQVEFPPTHFRATDPLGRCVEVPWTDLLFLTAGRIRQSPHLRHAPSDHEDSRGSTGLVADIFLTGGLVRFTVDAEHFDFGYLEKRLTEDPVQNLVYLIQDLAQFAPHAGLGRGAYQFRENPDGKFIYPSKAAYLEEITWLLWRTGRSQTEGSTWPQE